MFRSSSSKRDQLVASNSRRSSHAPPPWHRSIDTEHGVRISAFRSKDSPQVEYGPLPTWNRSPSLPDPPSSHLTSAFGESISRVSSSIAGSRGSSAVSTARAVKRRSGPFCFVVSVSAAMPALLRWPNVRNPTMASFGRRREVGRREVQRRRSLSNGFVRSDRFELLKEPVAILDHVLSNEGVSRQGLSQS